MCIINLSSIFIMPKLKIDHIVSFSSEDSIHIANNVLLMDPLKKWKCQTEGEKSANIILQLEKVSEVSGIDIGNEHSAYVEVLVKRSSTTDDFKVLLVMSSFMTALESRQSSNINKVRMFHYNEFQRTERDQKWDQIKIVCTQPFNRHVQYGLSFITLYSPEDKVSNSSSLKLGNFIIRPPSPGIKVGSLFARRKEMDNNTSLSAAAAIREASSSSTSKIIIHIKETQNAIKDQFKNNCLSKPRNRDELLYNNDEDALHDKIDKIIEQKNKEIKEKENQNTDVKVIDKNQQKPGKNKIKVDTTLNNNSPNSKNTNTKKRHIVVDTSQMVNKKQKKNVTKPFNRLLEGIMIVISGIPNPERSIIRDHALKMGAKYKSDWESSCTHLICAFTNTPKFNQVKGFGKIVNKKWISDCYNQRKRLPWRRYALETIEQNNVESEDEICELITN